MAELKQGVNGPAKGKIGNTVHYTMYGKHFVRSLPDVSSFKKTPKRMRQQQRMSLVVAFLQPFQALQKIALHIIKLNLTIYLMPLREMSIQIRRLTYQKPF